MQNQIHPKIIYFMKRPKREWIKILKLFRIDIGAKIFTNPQKTGTALTRPRRARATGARANNTTTNRKITDWGRRKFQIYGINIPELEKGVNKFHGGNISPQILN